MKTWLLVLLAACGTSSSEPEMTPDDCATCSMLSLRWTVESAGAASSCATVQGATVEVVATYQPDNSTHEISGACANGAMLSDALPLGPYQLAFELDDADGTAIAMAMTSTTLIAKDVISEAMVTFDAKAHATPGHSFGPCAANDTCLDAGDTCVVQNGHGYCSPSCSHDCPQAEGYLPDGSPVTELCVPYQSGNVCVLIGCASDDNCPAGLACDPSNARCF